MATFVQTAAQLFSGGVKFTCFTDQLSLEMTADPVEFTNYCSTGAREYRQGLRTWQVDAQGFADFAAVGATTGGLVPGEEIIPANLNGTTTNLTICPVDGSEGAVAYLASGAYSQMMLLGGAVGDPGRYGFTAVPATLADGHKLVRGRLEANRTVTSSSNTTGTQFGAVASGQRLAASLHVFTLSGTSPTLTVKVQSDDNSSFTSATDRISFSAASTRSGQFSYIDGPVTDDYWRVSWTIGGSATPTVAFAVAFGIA